MTYEVNPESMPDKDRDRMKEKGKVYICKYCGVTTSTPDAYCYKAPWYIKLLLKIKNQFNRG